MIQAVAEVVPSSSLVEVEVALEVEVGVEVLLYPYYLPAGTKTYF